MPCELVKTRVNFGFPKTSFHFPIIWESAQGSPALLPACCFSLCKSPAEGAWVFGAGFISRSQALEEPVLLLPLGNSRSGTFCSCCPLPCHAWGWLLRFPLHVLGVVLSPQGSAQHSCRDFGLISQRQGGLKDPPTPVVCWGDRRAQTRLWGEGRALCLSHSDLTVGSILRSKSHLTNCMFPHRYEI